MSATPHPSERRGRHLIIGAGFSGLGVAAALQRQRIDFDLVDAADAIGGNWYHGVYETVHIISSRKTTEYSDFPMPAHWPDFPSASQMLRYLHAYAEHWKLHAHLELDTRVVTVEPATGAEGHWLVTFERSGEREQRVYGGVIVCNGHHWARRWPRYPGELTAELIHSKDYKQPAQLVGKRVLVIGGGNSACDIAVEAARFASASHISLRRGYWFLPKTMLGLPTVELMRPWMPVPMQRALLKTMLKLVIGDYRRYGLPTPDHRPFDKHPTINSQLLYYLRHGRITPHPDVAAWHGREVEFTDGSREGFDLVVCATGYQLSFPFLAPGLVEIVDGLPRLIAGVLPTTHKNLYVFGTGQPRYGAGPLISAGAELMGVLIATQQRLRHPIGAVLERLGAKPPQTELVDPFRSLRRSRLARRIVPALPRLEPLLMRGKA